MTLPTNGAGRIGWITLFLSIAVLLVKTIVVAVETKRDVETMRGEIVVLREEIRIVHEDIKRLLVPQR